MGKAFLFLILISFFGSWIPSAVAETRSFAFWRGENIDLSTEEPQVVRLIIKKLSDGSETILHSFDRSAMLADAGLGASASAELRFGRIQASADGSEIIIGYGVKSGNDLKSASLEKLNLQDGTRSVIKQWDAGSPAGSFNYDFEPLTVDWTNQKIYFFETTSDSSIDKLVALPFAGGDAQPIKDIPGSPETVQLSPKDQNVMVMAEDENELGVLYVFDKNGVEQNTFKTSNVPNDHMFSFSDTGNEILYLYAPEGGNPSLKSMPKSGGSEITRFDYAALNAGSWNPFAGDGDFKDVESFFNENGGKIAFAPESLGEYSELVELDLSSGLTTILATGKANLPSVVDRFETGWIFSHSGAPPPQTEPSGSSSTPPANDPATPSESAPAPTPTPPQPSAWIAGANPVATGGDWKLSGWFGHFWEKPNSAWIYHPAIGWLYLVSNPDSSLWAYTQDLYSTPLWLWIKTDFFPYVYAKSPSTSVRRLGNYTRSYSRRNGNSSYGHPNPTLVGNKLISNWFNFDIPSTASFLPFNLTSSDGMLQMSYMEGMNSIRLFARLENQEGISLEEVRNSNLSDLTSDLKESNYFQTSSSHRAYYISHSMPVFENSYEIVIDGTNKSSSQTTWPWLAVFINISSPTMSLENAIAIANSINFPSDSSLDSNTAGSGTDQVDSTSASSENLFSNTPIPLVSKPNFEEGVWLHLDLPRGVISTWDTGNSSWNSRTIEEVREAVDGTSLESTIRALAGTRNLTEAINIIKASTGISEESKYKIQVELSFFGVSEELTRLGASLGY